MSIPEQVELQYVSARAAAEQKFADALRTAWTLRGEARWRAMIAAEDQLVLDLKLARERALGGER